MAYSGGALLVGALVWMLALHPPDLPNPLTWVGERVSVPGAEPVVVIVVGSAQNVALVRRAVSAERVVASLPGGFATDSGHIVTVSLEEAGSTLTAAGWIDRPLEIAAPARRRPETDEPDEDAPPMGGTMTQAQALALLDAIED